MNIPGVREDRRTGQFVPTVNGKDTSPTSFEEDRAMDISRQVCARMDQDSLALRQYQEANAETLDWVAKETNRQRGIIDLALIELGQGRSDKARVLLEQLTKGKP